MTWHNAAIFFGTWIAFYLLSAIIFAIVLIVEVVRDFRGKWPKLTRWQMVVVPFLFARHGLKHGLKWPYYLELQRRRDRDNAGYVRTLAKEMGIR